MSGGFERVRQDDHADIYCNGRMHVCLSGAQFGLSPLLSARHEDLPATIHTSQCNCTPPAHIERMPA